ncbi:hypothetical protein V6N13_040374 [Hibiscus sabdariffa]
MAVEGGDVYGPPLTSACAWGQRWIRGECFKIKCSPSLISDKSGKGCRHARDVAHDLGKESNHQSGAHGISKLQGLYGISHVDGRININEQIRKEKALSLVCGVETKMLTVDYDEIKNEGQGFAQDKTNTLGKERRQKHSRWPLTLLQQLWVLNRQKYVKLMEDEVTGLMENLRFTEEELKDVSIEGEEMMANVEDADKWVVAKLISPGIVDGVDLSKGRQNLRKKPGIVYANGKQELSRKEETGEHGMDSVEELEKKTLQIERGKEVGPSVARSRTVMRSLKGKNEVCNPISAKTSKTFSNVVGMRTRFQRLPHLSNSLLKRWRLVASPAEINENLSVELSWVGEP